MSHLRRRRREMTRDDWHRLWTIFGTLQFVLCVLAFFGDHDTQQAIHGVGVLVCLSAARGERR